jgi:hypothetical protein
MSTSLQCQHNQYDTVSMVHRYATLDMVNSLSQPSQFYFKACNIQPCSSNGDLPLLHVPYMPYRCHYDGGITHHTASLQHLFHQHQHQQQLAPGYDFTSSISSMIISVISSTYSIGILFGIASCISFRLPSNFLLFLL